MKCFLTQFLCWVDILHIVTIDVDQDSLNGAVRQTRVQTGRCKHSNNVSQNKLISLLKNLIALIGIFKDKMCMDTSSCRSLNFAVWCVIVPGVTPTTSPV